MNRHVTKQIDGSFSGFGEDALFKLTDGTYWAQAEYKYWYFYAYRPHVLLFEQGGRTYLQPVGHEKVVAVRRVSDVVESQIDGEFKGWDGKSVYRLVNGQVWEQRTYKYEYVYSLRPDVIVFDAGSGPVMQVENTTAEVRRVR